MDNGFEYNFEETDRALEWARINLPPYYYDKIKKSYDMLTIRTILCVVLCIPIIIVFFLIATYTPFTSKSEANTLPDGATTSREASIDYDDNFYWTYDSKKYEGALADYGLNPDNYKFGDKVTIYIDDEQNVYDVTELKEGISPREIEQIIGFAGTIILPIIIILCIYLPIAFNTFGKPCRKYFNWFRKRNSTIDELYAILK